MDNQLLIDAIVRQTTVLIAQLATSGGGRAQLAHTANQVFVDLVSALKEQGLGNKVIADMFGMALRTYQTRLQRLSESRTDRGHSLWEALLSFVQEKAKARPLPRTDIMQRFRHDDPLLVGGVLRDLVDSGLLYRSGRGDFATYVLAEQPADASAISSDEQLDGFAWMCVHRLAPATATQVAEALSLDEERVKVALERLLRDGRIQKSDRVNGAFECDACVLPLGSERGWEVALFDHYQAVVMAICTKLTLGKRNATAGDLVGGSTFGFQLWDGHPHYEEASGFLKRFRAEGSALRQKIATYNEDHEPPPGGEQRIVIYAGQTLLGIDTEREDGS